MHNFKTNGNFSKYLSLTYSFRLKINYNGYNFVDPWLKLSIQTLLGPRIKHILKK